MIIARIWRDAHHSRIPSARWAVDWTKIQPQFWSGRFSSLTRLSTNTRGARSRLQLQLVVEAP